MSAMSAVAIATAELIGGVGLTSPFVLTGIWLVYRKALPPLRSWYVLGASADDIEQWPLDGGLHAVRGRVEPVDEPLTAPFSNAACVLYEWHVWTRTTGSKQEWAMGSDSSSFRVSSSEGSVLVDPAEVDVHLETREITAEAGEQPPDRFRSFIDSDSFQAGVYDTLDGYRGGKLYNDINKKFQSLDLPDGQLDYDLVVKERRVEPDETVVVAGQFDTETDPRAGQHQSAATLTSTRLLPAVLTDTTPDRQRSSLRNRGLAWLGLGGVLCFAPLFYLVL